MLQDSRSLNFLIETLRQARVIRTGQKWEFIVLLEASLQVFKNAIRNLDIFGILENNCDCCDLYRS